MTKKVSTISKPQWILIGSAFLLFCFLYFGLDTKPKKQALIEQSRIAQSEATDIRVLVKEAKANINSEKLAYLSILENDLGQNSEDPISSLEKLAGKWFEYDYPEISGYYAEEIAKIRNDEDSWSLAGTTFTLGLKQAKNEKIRAYCSQHALLAYEKAISLSPDQIDHRINQALVYVENPLPASPMKGIQMLLGLNEKHPQNVAVMIQLGRLAIKTGQYERAVERLTKALSIEPTHKNANCLLSEAYKGLGDATSSREYEAKCNEL